MIFGGQAENGKKEVLVEVANNRHLMQATASVYMYIHPKRMVEGRKKCSDTDSFRPWQDNTCFVIKIVALSHATAALLVRRPLHE